MPILNFREIERPTRNPKKGLESTDLDAFEKFAEEFFCQILGAELITRMRRGPDNLLDLKVRLNGRIAIVSCKHQAHSDTAVSAESETNAFSAMVTNDCDLFIGFYSTAPSGPLITLLEGFKNNSKFKFDYQIFKNTDIESILLSSDNALGWLFAARYFPKSYANLFRRFVVPIEHYKISDLKNYGQDSWILDGPYGGLYSNPADKETIVKIANDSLTNSVHASFFNEAMRDAICTFPRYFSYRSDADLTALKIEDITPEWDRELSYETTADCNLPIIVCAIWSFWDPARSASKYRDFKNGESGIESFEHYRYEWIFGHLTIGSTAHFSHGYFRDLFARLIAFCPPLLKVYEGKGKQSFESPEGGVINWAFDRSEGLEFISNGLLARLSSR